jgi:protein phosphatase
MMTRAFASVGECTAVGRVRRHNEDSLRVDREADLLIVADGMGGHAAGDVASRVASEAVQDRVMAAGESLAGALRRAHAAVLDAARQGLGAQEMGTTCVACRLQGRELACAWVGDSRIYRWHDGQLEQLSHDHSHVQSLVDAGALPPEAAATHPERNILSQCLGGFDAPEPEVEARAFKVEAGDRVLLCTDGLTGELSDAQIERLLTTTPDDAHAAQLLVDTALAAGGHDNVTVVLATV